jgi:hypothetical protein
LSTCHKRAGGDDPDKTNAPTFFVATPTSFYAETTCCFVRTKARQSIMARCDPFEAVSVLILIGKSVVRENTAMWLTLHEIEHTAVLVCCPEDDSTDLALMSC